MCQFTPGKGRGYGRWGGGGGPHQVLTGGDGSPPQVLPVGTLSATKKGTPSGPDRGVPPSFSRGGYLPSGLDGILPLPPPWLGLDGGISQLGLDGGIPPPARTGWVYSSPLGLDGWHPPPTIRTR